MTVTQLWHGVNYGTDQLWNGVNYETESITERINYETGSIMKLSQLWHGVNYDTAKSCWPNFTRVYFREIKTICKLIVTCVGSNLYTSLVLVRANFIFLNYCYWVCKHNQVLFSPDSSSKICEKPSKFAIGVRTVIVVFA